MITPRTATSTGLHYIEVRLYADSGSHVGNVYDMEAIVARHSSNWTRDDYFEFNDNSSSAAALESTEYWGQTANGANDSEDWYSVYLAVGETLTAELLFLDSNADLDLQLRGPNGTTVHDSSYSSSNTESVTHTANSSGTYYLRVYVFAANPQSTAATDYDMEIQVN